jgi:alpha-tubulin suppressor-like RCC1 family protein
VSPDANTIGWSWGSVDGPARLSVTTAIHFDHIATADGYFVGLDKHGDAWTWGSLSGVAPPISLNSSVEPTEVSMPPGIRFTAVAMNDGYILAIDKNGRIWGWGRNMEGELGTGTTANSETPVEVRTPPGLVFTSVSAGRFFALALDSSGQAWSWGEDEDGVLGNGSLTDVGTENVPGVITQPVEVATPPGVVLTAVAAGDVNAVALDSHGNAWAWGSGDEGELGTAVASVASGPGTCEARIARESRIVVFVCSDTPVAVHMPTGVTFTHIAAAENFVLALDSTRHAWAWGSNVEGELGLASSTLPSTCSLNGPCSSAPQRVETPPHVRLVAISAAWNEAMALDTNGHVWGWGDDDLLQLGVSKQQCTAPTISPDFPCSNAPIELPMPDGVTFGRIAAARNNLYGFTS